MTRRWLALASSLVLCNTLLTPAVAQEPKDQTTGHSFFGNWFGWGGGDKGQAEQMQDQGTNANQQSNRYRQSGAANGNGMRQAGQKQGSDQLPPDPAFSQTDALPGLGGSPL